MPVSLSKGEKITLTKDSTVESLSVCLGWDTSKYDDDNFDLDALCFVLQNNGKTRKDEDFIFYGNLEHPSGGIKHSGDDLVGGGDKDNEIIKINLSKVPLYASKIVFYVSIYEAARRMQNFSMVDKSFIRIVDNYSGKEIVRYDLQERFGNSTIIEVGEIYRDEKEWKFHAIGDGYKATLEELCNKYGIEVE